MKELIADVKSSFEGGKRLFRLFSQTAQRHVDAVYLHLWLSVCLSYSTRPLCVYVLDACAMNRHEKHKRVG